ncbi:MAG: cupin domain-containing protein [Pontiella sp.]
MKLIKINEQPEVGVSQNKKIRKRVWVGNGVLNNITNFSRVIFPPGEKTARHQHDDIDEVFTCESGCGEVRINDVGYIFSAGTTVVVKAGELHEMINSGSTNLIVSYFSVRAE